MRRRLPLPSRTLSRAAAYREWTRPASMAATLEEEITWAASSMRVARSFAAKPAENHHRMTAPDAMRARRRRCIASDRFQNHRNVKDDGGRPLRAEILARIQDRPGSGLQVGVDDGQLC